MPEIVIGKKLPENEDFAQKRTARAFWRASYAGGRKYVDAHDAHGQPVLWQHARESEEHYRKRKRYSKLRNYVKSIIDRYNDHIFRSGIQRPEATNGQPYSILLDNADGAGTPLNQLMRKALLDAQVEGCAYLLADSTGDGTGISQAQSQASGDRVIIRRVSADAVPWVKRWQGVVVAAIVVMTGRDGQPFAWYVTEKTQQRINLAEENGVYVVSSFEDEQAHTYGGCPLVGVELMQAQAEDLSESQQVLFNLGSLLMEEQLNNTFSQWVLRGASADQVAEATVGANRLLCVENPSGGVDVIGSDVTQAASLRESIRDEINELYRIAGLSPGNPTQAGAPGSGVALAFQFNEVAVRLSAYADRAQDAENLIVERWASASRVAYPGDCDYPDDFDTPDAAADIERAIRVNTSTLPRTIKQAEVMRLQAEVYPNMTPEQKAAFALEVEEVGSVPARQFDPAPFVGS